MVEVEVEPVAHLDDVDAVDVRAVAQDELLEPEDAALALLLVLLLLLVLERACSSQRKVRLCATF